MSIGSCKHSDSADLLRKSLLPHVWAAAPFDMDLSPGGSRICVVYGYEAAVYDLASGERLTAIPIPRSALADCLFIDEDHILVAAADGVENYEITTDKVLWTGEKATFLTIS